MCIVLYLLNNRKPNKNMYMDRESSAEKSLSQSYPASNVDVMQKYASSINYLDVTTNSGYNIGYEFRMG